MESVSGNLMIVFATVDSVAVRVRSWVWQLLEPIVKTGIAEAIAA